MITFLAVELDVTLPQLTSVVAKSKLVSDANTPCLFLQLDLGKNENLSDIDKVELGSTVTSALANLKVKEVAKSKFRKDFAAIVLKSIAKIKERCPLKYTIVRNAVWLSPSEMICNADPSITRAKRLFQSLYELKLLCAAEADQAKQEYLEFMSSVVVTAKKKFISFDKDEDHLDSFMGSLMHGNADYVNLWKVCRIIFVLSHDQADVGRVFNINRELLVENMKELSLISQRTCVITFLQTKVICTITKLVKSCCLAAKGLA